MLASGSRSGALKICDLESQKGQWMSDGRTDLTDPLRSSDLSGWPQDLHPFDWIFSIEQQFSRHSSCRWNSEGLGMRSLTASDWLLFSCGIREEKVSSSITKDTTARSMHWDSLRTVGIWSPHRTTQPLEYEHLFLLVGDRTGESSLL